MEKEVKNQSINELKQERELVHSRIDKVFDNYWNPHSTPSERRSCVLEHQQLLRQLMTLNDKIKNLENEKDNFKN